VNILIVNDRVILTEVSEEVRLAVAAAAGPNAVVTVATNRDQAMAAAPEAEVILGSIDEELFTAASQVKWV
jgi:hypothetical protein